MDRAPAARSHPRIWHHGEVISRAQFEPRAAALASALALCTPACEAPRDQTETFLGTATACIDLSSWPTAETTMERALQEALNLRRADSMTCEDTSASPRVSLDHDPRLRCAARMSARDMGVRGRLAPIDSLGRDCAGRVAAAGTTEVLVLGEAQARGIESVQQALDSWLLDPDTCALLQDASARQIGVGIWSESAVDPLYWSVVVARPAT
jgi:uncharacterized protein YkwD